MEESSLLTTFNCSLGRYRFTRMPFGVSVAGDVFQQKLDECIGDIRNVYCIADDIMVVGYEEDHSDHDKALTNLFQRAEKCNLKFNLDKIQYKKKPVYYASRAIGEAEKNYVAIELESLAVAWAFKKLHHFIYGKKFKLQTDQKPLATILSRSQNASTPRLQRLLNQAFQYDFNVDYIKGETNVLADCLSCLGVTKDQIKLPKAMVHSVSVELSATKDFLDRVRTASQKDQELQLLTQQVKLGWPKKISEVDDKIKCYWSFREDITVADDILVKGHRIIVPKDMREYMLDQVHKGHFGMDKCKMRMSNCCYWPNVNKEIEEMIRNCPTCLEFAPAKPKIKKKDMLHHEVPSTPWMKLATDIFHFQGMNYLILVDYTSQ